MSILRASAFSVAMLNSGDASPPERSNLQSRMVPGRKVNPWKKCRKDCTHKASATYPAGCVAAVAVDGSSDDLCSPRRRAELQLSVSVNDADRMISTDRFARLSFMTVRDFVAQVRWRRHRRHTLRSGGAAVSVFDRP